MADKNLLYNLCSLGTIVLGRDPGTRSADIAIRNMIWPRSIEERGLARTIFSLTSVPVHFPDFSPRVLNFRPVDHGFKIAPMICVKYAYLDSFQEKTCNKMVCKIRMAIV